MAVKLRFVPQDKRIKVGMYGRVKLITTSIQNAIIIPSTAIVTKNNNKYVFVVANRSNNTQSTVRMQQITEGISVDNFTEVTSGLSVSDEIVIKGQTLLNDGSKVNVVSVSQKD